ncbi:hypothetical protein [Methanosalsum natronophilum]|uniref:hypothetical protein n=1 Tax=Methanosalsum natronophilum TaxID=768733 RepID=UPI00216A36D0|nr:hypothetical protein [Methanosalsum natronophilum]MCS3924108.1 hypothetical protein [Methanosalsum natronophilum]
MPFNFEDIKLDASFDQNFATKKIITKIPVRKPNKTEFFQIRDDPDWQIDTLLVDLNDGDDEKYLVLPEFAPELEALGLLKKVRIYTAITYSTNILLISEVALPDADGKHNEYNRSRLEAYEIAKTKWIKIVANRSIGTYERHEPLAKLDEPIWPEEPKTFNDALNLAFKDKLIDSSDHPVLKKLRGEV